jgi:SulP family sulfate permease
VYRYIRGGIAIEGFHGRFSIMHWKKIFPGLAVVANYDRSQLRYDSLAALVVTLVLIPSAFAYSDLANCAPAAGFYAAVSGMIAFALFTSSRHVIAGPDAAIALMVGAAIGPLAGGDVGKAVTLSAVLALLTAVVLFLMARLRLGIAADFLSSPALHGFMNGAAVVIIASQLGKFSGIALKEDNTLMRLWEWVMRFGELHGPTTLLGIICVTLMLACRWKSPQVPGAVIVFVLGLVAGRFVDFTHYGMQVIGRVDLNVPDAIRPGLSLRDAAPLFTAAIGIALLAFSEGVVLGRSVAARHGYAVDPDRELIALGAANFVSALLGSFSVGSSQTRTLLNDATGGRSQVVSFIAAGMTTAFVVLLAPWIATIPAVAIAAILVVTGFTLIDFRVYRHLWQMHRFSMIVAVVTTVGVVALGVLPGILLGVVLSVLGVLAAIVRPHDALLGRVEGSSTLHDVGDDREATTIPGLVAYRFYGPLIFANVRFFIERLNWFIDQEKTPVRQVIVDARAIPSIDITAAEELSEFAAKLRKRGIEFIVAKAHLPLREAASTFGQIDKASWRFAQLADAVEAFQKELPETLRPLNY